MLSLFESNVCSSSVSFEESFVNVSYFHIFKYGLILLKYSSVDKFLSLSPLLSYLI